MQAFPQQLRALFEAANAQPADHQAQWLIEHCADPNLRERVQRLLQAQASSLDPLRVPLEQRLAALDARPDTIEPRQLGDFILIEPVGRGGMATVFLAQRQGFDQRVAIKLLHRTLHSDLDRQLFERERKALASLEHPNIARLIDAGVTEQREPFLVLEFVEGKVITDYAHHAHLGFRARVALMIEVCRAVAHAHARLIVHRDLKPSNVLIDREGHCKLLDFGLAKFLTEDSDVTRRGGTGFTPSYAAPEQLSDGQISTQTDVYALGVMLLELLAGDNRIARDVKPSLAVLRGEVTEPSRALSKSQLVQFLRGDLDNVLLKCMESNADQRYQSAAQLAEDLQRFLDNLPVSAHPPSRWYTLQKFVRRHRGGVLLTTLLVLVTLGSLALAIRAGIEARAQAAAAEKAAAEARGALQVSQAVQAFLLDIFYDAVPRRPQDQSPSLTELVERAEVRIREDFADLPEISAELFFRTLSLRDALGARNEALKFGAESLAYLRPQLGETSFAYRQLAMRHARNRFRAGEADALAEMRRLVALQQADDDFVGATLQRMALASALAQTGKPEGINMLESELPELRRRCVGAALRKTDPQFEGCLALANALNSLAIFQPRTRVSAAIDYVVESIDISRRLGEDNTLNFSKQLANLANNYLVADQFDNALKYARQSEALITKIAGAESLDAHQPRLTEAAALSASGQKLAAWAVYERLLADVDAGRQVGREASAIALSAARTLLSLGRYLDAQTQATRFLPQWQVQPAANLEYTIAMHQILAIVQLEGHRDAAKALTEIDAALGLEKSSKGRYDSTTLCNAHRIAIAATETDAAEQYWQALEQLDTDALPPPAQRTLWLRRTEFAIEQRRFEAAQTNLALVRKSVGVTAPHQHGDQWRVVELELAQAQGQTPSIDAAWLADLQMRWGEQALLVQRAKRVAH